ncbi:hypothetical protein FD723_40600 (plasmid) [Nostoc sp. C052]|uniref:DUF2227 family putative metal-binding protein n=1 Tax=Nostoc sp. C052 TaxID=2576902 RepID=UPI0015C35BB9|nr:hypothetical protein FD723_40600 [Nostoc sp. C052]
METDKLVFVLMVGWVAWFFTAAVSLIFSTSIIFSILLTSGYLEGAFLLREDLKFRYWGHLRIIWLPYQKVVKFPSKIPIVNILLQLAYLLAFFLFAQFLLYGIFSLPNSANKPVINLLLSLVLTLRSHLWELLVWLIGIVGGNYVGRRE